MALPITYRRVLVWIVVLGALFRLLYVLTFVDLSKDYYWEYGKIARFLHDGQGYSYYSVENGAVTASYQPGATPLPSAYMAPGYVWFLTPFLTIDTVWLRNLIILSIHILASAALLIAMFRMTANALDERTGVIGAALCAFLPEFIYAVGSYTPTVFYHLGVVLLLSLLYEMRKGGSSRLTIVAGLIQVALVYARMEMFLFGIFIVTYLAYLRQLRQALLYFIIMTGLLAPWAIRNQLVFDEFVPFTTGGGLNLFRGHNADEIGAWEDSVTSMRIRSIQPSRKYEVERDRVYTTRVGEFLREHPEQEVLLTFQKIAGLWLWNSRDVRSTHPIYLIPWGMLLVCAVLGLRRLKLLSRHMPLFLFLAYSTCLAILFFVLPRYQTMMKIGLIPIAAARISGILSKKRTISASRSVDFRKGNS